MRVMNAVKRAGWGFLVYSLGYAIGRSVGRDECAKVIAKHLPPDASVSRLLHPSGNRSSAWN